MGTCDGTVPSRRCPLPLRPWTYRLQDGGKEATQRAAPCVTAPNDKPDPSVGVEVRIPGGYFH